MMRAKIKSNKIRSKDDVIFDVVDYTFLTILVIIVLYPPIYVVSASLHFSGGMLPVYLLMDKLHLIDTMWVIILPGMIGVHNMVITKNFFENSLPKELKEAAMLDGCSEFKYLLKFVLPLSKAVLAVIAMYYAVGHWNAFFGALIYLTDEIKYPLQLVLRSILIENEMASSMMEDLNLVAQQQYAEMIKYGVVIVSSLPVLCIYPFVQKYFVKGVMAGSVKGKQHSIRHFASAPLHQIDRPSASYAFLVISCFEVRIEAGTTIGMDSMIFHWGDGCICSAALSEKDCIHDMKKQNAESHGTASEYRCTDQGYCTASRILQCNQL